MNIQTLITQEINFLQNCINEVRHGGWSTNLVGPMEKRITELQKLYYEASH